MKYIKKLPRKTVIAYLSALGVMLFLFLTLYFTVGKSLTAFVSDTESFKAWLQSYKSFGAVIFVFIRAFQTVIKIIPAEPLEIASGYVFGTFGGLFLCSLGSFLGSLVILFLSRKFGRRFIEIFINEEEFHKLSRLGGEKKQSLFLTVFYLIPGTPKDVFTYIAGATGMNITRFLLITTAARIPSIITSTACGAQIEKENFALALIIFAVTAVMSVICTAVYKRYSYSKA